MGSRVPEPSHFSARGIEFVYVARQHRILTFPPISFSRLEAVWLFDRASRPL